MGLLTTYLNHVQSQPNKCALLIDDKRISYRQLHDDVLKVFESLPLFEKGSRIGIAIHQPERFTVWYLAVLFKGGVPCVCDAMWKASRLEDVQEAYGFAYLVNQHEDIVACKNAYTKHQPDTLHIGFTSGTTGTPKAYVRSLASWIASFKENDKLFDDAPDVLIAPGPHAHSLTLYAIVYALYKGLTFIGQTQFNASLLSETVQLVDGKKAAFLVPTMILSIVAQRPMPDIETLLSSGAKLPPSLFERIQHERPHTRVIEFFGTSEASFISYNANQAAPSHSVGQLFSNVEAHLDNPDSDGVGRLLVKGPMTFSGYLNQTDDDEWIETGDYASIDDHQYLYLHGRLSDRMNIGGKNVYPEEIERYVLQHDHIQEVVCFSIPHRSLGEIVILLFTSNSKVTPLEIREYCKKGLERYKRPFKVKEVQNLTHTHSGKIARHMLRAQYLEGALE